MTIKVHLNTCGTELTSMSDRMNSNSVRIQSNSTDARPELLLFTFPPLSCYRIEWREVTVTRSFRETCQCLLASFGIL